MNNSKFIADFITDCATKGFSSAEEICKEADIQIKILNEEIGKIQKLKIKRSNLQSVIRQLSDTDESDRKSRPMADFTKPEKDLTSDERKMCCDICDYVEKNPDRTPTQIIEATASMLDQELVFGSIKWLAFHGIIKQIPRDQARVVCIGDNWDNRPKINEGS